MIEPPNSVIGSATRPAIGVVGVTKGAITQAELDKMSEEQKTNLIFLPNVSSKDDISELSGRGVGMDVVKKNIEGMGGVIQVTTAHQKGTKFTFTFKSEL